MADQRLRITFGFHATSWSRTMRRAVRAARRADREIAMLPPMRFRPLRRVGIRWGTKSKPLPLLVDGHEYTRRCRARRRRRR